MATISIGQQPGLTKERAREIFAERFASQYEIVRSNAINRDFIVRKNGWTGVGVRLKEEKNGDCTFVFSGMMPNILLQTLFGGLFSFLLLRKGWKEMELEVAGFIRLEPQFQQKRPPYEAPQAQAA
jgi:hypothetical protein